MAIAAARTALAGALAWLTLGAAGVVHAETAVPYDNPFYPTLPAEFQPVDTAALRVPVVRAAERARSSFRPERSRSPYHRKKVKLIRYQRPFEFAEREFVLKLRARPKRTSIVQVKVVF